MSNETNTGCSALTVHIMTGCRERERDRERDRKTFQKQEHRQHYYRSEYCYVNRLLKITPCGVPSCDPDNEGNDAQGPHREQCHRAYPIHRQQTARLRYYESTLFLQKDNILGRNVWEDSSIFEGNRLKIVPSLRRELQRQALQRLALLGNRHGYLQGI